MIVRCDANQKVLVGDANFRMRTGWFEPQNFDLDIEVGQTYAVLSVLKWKGLTGYLLWPNELDGPEWYPSDLFTVVDDRLSAEWKSAVPGCEDQMGFEPVHMVTGFLEDRYLYDKLIEGDPDTIFWMYKIKARIEAETGCDFSGEEYVSARPVEGSWRQCDECANIWEESHSTVFGRCPDCGRLTRLEESQKSDQPDVG